MGSVASQTCLPAPRLRATKKPKNQTSQRNDKKTLRRNDDFSLTPEPGNRNPETGNRNPETGTRKPETGTCARLGVLIRQPAQAGLRPDWARGL
jgi:hypothetical protein